MSGEEASSASKQRELELEESLQSQPDDPCLHFDLGLLLWEKAASSTGDEETRGKAAEQFLISAKLNPHNGVAFRYLGHYYASFASDPQRALKCYQRAICLNPDDSDAGEAMCEVLEETGKENLEIAVCREASEKSPRAFWAFSRLGYLLVHQQKWADAIPSLQHAIRGYPTCTDLWEALGLSYQQMGMFTAAAKSYGRAIELDESRVFALVESGNIFLILGNFRKGIELFRQAIRISPFNVSSHYGLASAIFCFAKECVSSGAFRWGASLLEEASKVAVACTSLAGNISCIWKLHGDIQLMYAKCFPWIDEGFGLQSNEKAFTNSVHSWKRICSIAAISASRSYQRALHFAPWQANLYTDVAIALEPCFSLKESHKDDPNVWSRPEKMCLGGLMLEGCNQEFWVTLGCLTNDTMLKQHAYIRGLQLDVSLAVAWANLGMLYRKEGECQFAQNAFDCARSIDPSLPLPWAGMSADADVRNLKEDEAYECCLRAVQIFPLAEFQTGLAMLALHSGHLKSSEVFGAIQQALHRVPSNPESHNLKGLVCEARHAYQNAIASYRLARYAARIFGGKESETYLDSISINLARSLCKDGNVNDAVHECEVLDKKGLLDAEGLQIYALCLWKLGKDNLALSVASKLAANISSTDKSMDSVSISFLCRLQYQILGQDASISFLVKQPKGLSQSPKFSLAASAVHALDPKNRLDCVIASARYSVASVEESSALDFLAVLGELLKKGSRDCLGFKKGLQYVCKSLHMSPNSHLIRNLLGRLLLFSTNGKDFHASTRCIIRNPSDHPNADDRISALEIFGAEGVACHALQCSELSLTNCRGKSTSGCNTVQLLQNDLHHEPWNQTTRYLLIANIFQRARRERFPHHLCVALDRLTSVVLSNELYSIKDLPHQYQKFQLLLIAAEVSLQSGNYVNCIKNSNSASILSIPNQYNFFAHLLLCRAYAVDGNSVKLSEEYLKCLELKTGCHIGWICLKCVESQYKLHTDSTALAIRFEECSKGVNHSWNTWLAIFSLVQGLSAIWTGDFSGAEEYLSQACLLASGESFLFLCHAAICMELARQHCDSKFITIAIKSLNKAKEATPVCMPFISLLLAQAEASLGSETKWEKNVVEEWSSWPPEMKPAEVFFQMHLVSRLSWQGGGERLLEGYANSIRWMLQAIHLNPSSSRYWRVLRSLLGSSK
ncbi:unnamed protein product [Cuscuta campestris]|uniref:Uncharacterized protein n=1 Tax=Cuscuta campestris TaxID=132261 RepID=A0A484MW25_9ASTE|nr:unnamed protein product [Cuscuta campestris]